MTINDQLIFYIVYNNISSLFSQMSPTKKRWGFLNLYDYTSLVSIISYILLKNLIDRQPTTSIESPK
jgi:hypothetical protein